MLEAWQNGLDWLYRLADFFSFGTILKTLFAPWKNDTYSAQNLALSDRVKVWEANIASRAVGFIIRIFVILIALILIGLGAMGFFLYLAAWLLLPVLVIALPLTAVLILQ